MLMRLCGLIGLIALPALAQTGEPTRLTLNPSGSEPSASMPRSRPAPAPATANVANPKAGQAVAGDGSAGRGASGQEGVAADDGNFVKSLTQTAMADVALAKVAELKARRWDVKDLAKRMAADHEKANQQLGNIARKLKITVPGAIDDRRKAGQGRLEQVSAEDFDAAYLIGQLHSYRRTIVLLERHVWAGESPELRRVASWRLPQIREFVRQAETIWSDLPRPRVASAAAKPTFSGQSQRALSPPSSPRKGAGTEAAAPKE